jgi:hypothetical protein
MRNEQKLSPGCTLAHCLAKQELRGEAMSIEYLRAAMDSVPTYPEAWTLCEGADYCAMFAAQ